MRPRKLPASLVRLRGHRRSEQRGHLQIWKH
jgi:hypothetical protein